MGRQINSCIEKQNTHTKVENFIKTDDVETALQKTNTSLAVLCKKKRTRVASQKKIFKLEILRYSQKILLFIEK